MTIPRGPEIRRAVAIVVAFCWLAACQPAPFGGQPRAQPASVRSEHFHVMYIGLPEPPAPLPDIGYLEKIAAGLETAYAAFVDRYGFDAPRVIADGGLMPVRVQEGLTPQAFRDKIHLPTSYDDTGIQNTTAHEFFHTIQAKMAPVASFHLNEGTATWAEDIVNAERDGRNTYAGSANIWLERPWTNINRYGFSLFFKYLTEQEGRPAAGVISIVDPRTESWGVEVMLEFFQGMQSARAADGIPEIAQSQWELTEVGITAVAGTDATMVDYYRRFLAAVYTKRLGDPFRNLMPSAGAGVTLPLALAPRWDFVEDEEADYLDPPFSRDGETLAKSAVLEIRNDLDPYANGTTGFTSFAQFELIRIGLDADVEQVYFEGIPAAGQVDVGFLSLVHYTRLDGSGDYVRTVPGPAMRAGNIVSLYGTDIGFPAAQFRAAHLLVMPFCWNPRLLPANAQSETGRFFHFKVVGDFP